MLSTKRFRKKIAQHIVNKTHRRAFRLAETNCSIKHIPCNSNLWTDLPTEWASFWNASRLARCVLSLRASTITKDQPELPCVDIGAKIGRCDHLLTDLSIPWIEPMGFLCAGMKIKSCTFRYMKINYNCVYFGKKILDWYRSGVSQLRVTLYREKRIDWILKQMNMLSVKGSFAAMYHSQVKTSRVPLDSTSQSKRSQNFHIFVSKKPGLKWKYKFNLINDFLK